MATLGTDEIARLLQPYVPNPSALILEQLSLYLDLLLKWNARTNLTAIRDPKQIVQRHFGESLFTARHLPPATTLLDFGSGAGFPGLPIQLVYPDLQVTLAESQNKKASFLREVIRTLNLPTQVWPSRVEDFPAETLFHIITMRAVDNPAQALAASRLRCSPVGTLALLSATQLPSATILQVPGSNTSYLNLLKP